MAINRLLGTLAGIGASLAAVALWMLLGMFGIIAGYVGALMGLLFIIVYKRVNRADLSLYPYIFAAVLMVIEVAGAEMLGILMYAVVFQYSFVAVLQMELASHLFYWDVALGLAFSFLSFGLYLPFFRRRDKIQKAINNRRGDPSKYTVPPLAGELTEEQRQRLRDPFGDDPFGHNDN